MKFFVFISFLAHYSLAYSQYSDRLSGLINDLKHSDSSFIENQYTDGTLKSKGAYLYYDMPEYRYSKKAGLWVEYYKTGGIKTEAIYDKLGNLLSKSLYDLNGRISTELTAHTIDANISDAKNYFRRNDEVIITFRIKTYKYSKALDKIYLREVGMTKGGKRIGIWKFYTQSGRLERETNFDD